MPLNNLCGFTLGLLFITTLLHMKAQEESRGYIVKVGDVAPDFVMTLDNGKQVKLSDMKGKVVMLQFTASCCGVCRKEMPFIEEEIWQPNKEKDLVVIGIDREEPIETLQKFSEDTGITYPLALDPNSDIFGLFADKKSGVTRNVIIDQNGKIVFLTRLFNRVEFDQMKNKITEILP